MLGFISSLRSAFFEIEGAGQHRADGRHHRVALEVGADHDDVVAEFGEHLPADAARRDRRFEVADDGNRAEFALTLSNGCKDRGAFGAIGGAVRGFSTLQP